MASELKPESEPLNYSPIENAEDDELIKPGDHPIPKTARWEWLVIAIICVLCVGYWAAHYNRYYQPNPDYYSFEETARAIWSGRLPSDFWRMPVYPAIFGALAQILPVEDPYFHAALILNIIFSAAGLVLLFLLLRGITGRVAIIVVGFSALSMMWHDLAQKPLLEPFMLCMILLTLWLFQRGSRWQYVAAFFAALTRYEASSLLLILFLLNTFNLRGKLFGSISSGNYSALVKLDWGGAKHVLKHLLFAALASTGFLAWMVGSMMKGNPHVNIMGEWGWPTNPQVALVAAGEPFYIWSENARDGGYMLALFVLLIALPCIVGLFVSFKKFGRTSLAILLLLFFTVVILGVFGVFHRRYIYHIYWVPPLYFAVGWGAILALAERKLFGVKRRGKAVAVLSVITALILCAVLYDSFSKVKKADGTALRPLYVETQSGGGEPARILTPHSADLSANYVYPVFWFTMVVAFFAFGFRWGKAKGGCALIIGCILAALFAYYGAGEIQRHSERSYRRLYRYYDFVLVGKFLEENLNPGERATALDTGVIARTTDLPDDAVFRFSLLDAENVEELPAELQKRNINYVAYTWRATDELEEHPEKRRIHDKRQYDLMAEFMNSADSMEEFELVAVLKLPPSKPGNDPRVYRFVGSIDRAGDE